jgi:glycosyltransferase involved in cell wall biosynthesis
MLEKLSVVIPLYNKEFSVARAVNSILAQTYKDFELIVVDDGSTDNSLQIVKDFSDKRIKLIEQQNSGVAVARNHGVIAASSHYVCFLDADDAWEPFFLQEIATLVDANPNASLYSARYRLVDERGVVQLGNLSLADNFFGDCPNFFKAYQNSRSLICSSNVCVNKKHFTKIGGFPTGVKVGEDIYLWLRMALHAATMFSARISATVYRNSENRTHQRLGVTIPYHITFFLQDKTWHHDPLATKYRADVYSFIATNIRLHAAIAAFRGERLLALRYAKHIMSISLSRTLSIILISFMPRGGLSLIKRTRNFFTLAK